MQFMLKLKMIVCSSNILCLAKGQGKELWTLTLKPAVLYYCQGRNTVDSNVQNVYDILYFLRRQIIIDVLLSLKLDRGKSPVNKHWLTNI